MITGLVLYVNWFNTNAERYEDTAVPYLEKTLPVVARWKFSEFVTLLSPQARSEFETDKGRESYRFFTQLGVLESIGKPQYMVDKSGFSDGLGKIDIVTYQVPVKFETGPAVIKILLASDGESYFIHHLGISSELFAESAE